MPHHFHREVENLKKKVLSLSAEVEECLRQAVQAVENRDEKMATWVIEHDSKVDRLEVEVEEDCLKILALYQPVAIDLRFIVAVLKINNDLERIGDLAVNIAERAEALREHAPVQSRNRLMDMANASQSMLGRSLDALVNMDADLAKQVTLSDNEVDDMLKESYDLFYEGVKGDGEKIEPLVSILTCARCLERIADYATNIAEDVIYMIEGEIVRHKTKTDEAETA